MSDSGGDCDGSCRTCGCRCSNPSDRSTSAIGAGAPELHDLGRRANEIEDIVEQLGLGRDHVGAQGLHRSEDPSVLGLFGLTPEAHRDMSLGWLGEQRGIIG